jgi:murein DD-endopeptidase MepM/ murein hydrolase activator NlpD
MYLIKIRYNTTILNRGFGLRFILFYTILSVFLLASKVSYKEWVSSKTFLDYLSEHNISTTVLDTITTEDQKYTSEISSAYGYFEILDANLSLIQALIPINKEMQISLFRQKDSYSIDIIPIAYQTSDYFAKIEITSNPYTDTLNQTSNKALAQKITLALKNFNTKRLKQNDKIYIYYQQATRVGIPFLSPTIKAIQIQTAKNTTPIYLDDDIGYKDIYKNVPYQMTTKQKVKYKKRVTIKSKTPTFGMPLRHARITSSFSYRRWHPILHKYRPHHGTDFGARRGTPLLAVADGKIVYAGWMRGYGKVVKIKHKGGFISLYAHQSRIRVHNGQRVKRGQIIGYVGSTGRSTGPHLHFGLMKNGRWVDPMKYLGKTKPKSVLKTFSKYVDKKVTKYKKVAIKDAKLNQQTLQHFIDNNATTYNWQDNDITEVYRYDKAQFQSK